MLLLSRISKKSGLMHSVMLRVVSGTFCAAGTICSVLSALFSDIAGQPRDVVVPVSVTGLADNPNLPPKAKLSSQYADAFLTKEQFLFGVSHAVISYFEAFEILVDAN